MFEIIAADKLDDSDKNLLYELTRRVWPANIPTKDNWQKGWDWLHLKNPFEPSLIGIVRCDGKIVCQYPVTFVDLIISNRIVRAGQLIDTMTDPEYRCRGLATQLGYLVLNQMAYRNIPLVFCFPTKQVYSIHLKSAWLDLGSLCIMIKPLNISNLIKRRYFYGKIEQINLKNEDLLKECGRHTSINPMIKELYRFDKRINEFNINHGLKRNVMISRSDSYLNWRYIDIPNNSYNIYIAEANDAIFGYIVIGVKKSEKGIIYGYIYDLATLKDFSFIAGNLISTAVEYFRKIGVDIVFSQMIVDKSLLSEHVKNLFFPYLLSNTRFLVHNSSHRYKDEWLMESSNWHIVLGDLPGVY